MRYNLIAFHPLFRYLREMSDPTDLTIYVVRFYAFSRQSGIFSKHLSRQCFSGTLFGKKAWGPNVTEFRKRFDPETTNGQGRELNYDIWRSDYSRKLTE